LKIGLLSQSSSKRLQVNSFSPQTKYPEKELNLIIAKYHEDTAALRRYMIEYGILERDGESVYWLREYAH
jgi:hypothetical protein